MAGDAPGAPDLSEERDDFERIWVGSYNQGLDNLAWQQEQYGRQSAALDQMIADLRPIQSQANQMSQEAFEWSQGMRDRYEDVYQPIEDDLIADYETYNSGERIALDRAAAMTDVNNAFTAERENASRRLESYGIDPSQVRGQAMDRDVRLAEAATMSNAANQARLQTEATGRQLRADALNIGQQYPGWVNGGYNAANQSASLAMQAAALPVSATNSTVNSGMANRNAAIQPWNMSLGAIQGFTGAKTGNYNNQLNEYNAGTTPMGGAMSGASLGGSIGGPWGAAIGGGLGLLSGFFADGGRVPSPTGGALPAGTPGGVVTGPGGPRDDRAIIAASPGEFVVPEDVVRWKGEEFFAKTIDHARQAQAIPTGEK